MFFAYIGFDAISTAAEETKNPQRNLPIGILGGLAICTVIYIVIGAVLTGMVPSSDLGKSADPLAYALNATGMTSIAKVVALGAVFSMAAVLLVFQYGQPRIFFAMARDGLLPQWAAKVSHKARVPWVTTLLTGLFVALWSLIGDANETYDLTNIGTLFAFALVCIGVMVLRHTDPGSAAALPRSIRVRGGHRRRGALRHRDVRTCRGWRGSGSASGWPWAWPSICSTVSGTPISAERAGRHPPQATTDRVTDETQPVSAPAVPPRRRGLRAITQTQWIVISMVVGILLGYLFPDHPAGQPGFQASDLKVLSTIFLRMIKSLIVPLLFATLVVGIAGHGDDMKRVGKLAFRSIIYFELVTTLALVVGLARGERREARRWE